MNSYDVTEKAVKDYWVAFFQQKYSCDDKWERCEELVECHGSIDYENMTFLSYFCKRQTEVKNVVIVPLREVTSFYYKRKIEKHESKSITNADRIRMMTDEELAEWINKHDCHTHLYGYDNKEAILDWLRQEVENNG